MSCWCNSNCDSEKQFNNDGEEMKITNKPKYCSMAVALTCFACSSELDSPQEMSMSEPYRPHHAQTLRMGQADNAEVVKILPGSSKAIVVASKARKVSLIEVVGETIQELAATTLFDGDSSESELTHIDFAPDGRWAVLTRTKLSKDAAGEITDCGGSLVFIDAGQGANFGMILAEVEVGPMPDGVDVSPDGQWVVSANERDVVWGKCEGVMGLESPSLSVIDLREGPAKATEYARVQMSEDMAREPEQVVFAADSDLMVATLQDSHEILFIRRSDLKEAGGMTMGGVSMASELAGTLVKLPKNSIDQDAWPDGIASVLDGQGRELFVVAGEANDSIYVLDSQGLLIHQLEISASDIPASFPRDGSWGPLFRPDSIAAFRRGARSFIAVSLKASGAVGVWDLTDPSNPERIIVEKVGAEESALMNEESSLGSEGISASGEHGFILVANEGESSVSLLVP
jgi:hypothetical protein